MSKRQRKVSLLDEPIVRPDPLVVEVLAYGKSPAEQAVIREEAANFVWQQKLNKLALLALSYNVDIRAPFGFLELCLRLAEQHIKDFKVVDASPRRPGGPRKDQFELVKAINLRTDAGESVLQACRVLSKRKGPWKGRPPKALQTRYNEWHRQRPQRDPMVERLILAGRRARST
jgi:hypothetical protein